MDDSFNCPHCGATFTPQTFPFKVQYHSGGMGLGSERIEVLDSPCPKCKAIIPQSFFVSCRVCKQGAAKSSCAYQMVGGSMELYHFGCLSKLIPPIPRDRAKRFGQPESPTAGDSITAIIGMLPVWLWIAIGIVVFLVIAHPI